MDIMSLHYRFNLHASKKNYKIILVKTAKVLK